MLIEPPISPAIRKKKPDCIYSLISLSRMLLYVVFMAVACCLHTAGFGQKAAVGYPGRLRHIDVVPKIDTGQLSPQRKIQSREYATRLNVQKLNRKLYPFYPYIVINYNYLPPPPFRLYLGKLSTRRTGDFVLLAMKCRKDTSMKDVVLNSEIPAASQNWIYLQVDKNTSDSDRVKYRRINGVTAARLKKNFESFTASEKLDSPRLFPLCFVIQGHLKPQQKQLKLQPVVRTGRPPGSSGGASSWKRFFFQIGTEIVFLGEFDELNKSGNDACCQTPPEEGNSIPDHD